MKKHFMLASLVVLMAASGAAANNTTTPDPGWVGVGHPLHEIEMAFDQVRLAVGFGNSASIAQERAAEAIDALNSITNTSTNETVERTMNGVSRTMLMVQNIVNNSDTNSTGFDDVKQRLTNVKDMLADKRSFIENKLPAGTQSPFEGNESVTSRIDEAIGRIPDVGQ